MVSRCCAVLLLLGLITVGSLSLPRPSGADTLVQQNVDTRVVLAVPCRASRPAELGAGAKEGGSYAFLVNAARKPL
jgi:hypothetical protein